MVAQGTEHRGHFLERVEAVGAGPLKTEQCLKSIEGSGPKKQPSPTTSSAAAPRRAIFFFCSSRSGHHNTMSKKPVCESSRFVNLFFFFQLPRLAGPLRALVRDMVII